MLEKQLFSRDELTRLQILTVPCLQRCQLTPTDFWRQYSIISFLSWESFFLPLRLKGLQYFASIGARKLSISFCRCFCLLWMVAFKLCTPSSSPNSFLLISASLASSWGLLYLAFIFSSTLWRRHDRMGPLQHEPLVEWCALSWVPLRIAHTARTP